jgi:hypothetical protein
MEPPGQRRLSALKQKAEPVFRAIGAASRAVRTVSALCLIWMKIHGDS